MKGPEYANTVLEDVLMVTRGWRRWEMNDKGYGIFFWGSENILKLLDSDGFIYCE